MCDYKLKILEDLKNNNFDISKIEDYKKDLVGLEEEVNFLRTIDWIKLGKYLEFDKNPTFDLSGWEFLAKGWRDNDEAKILWYIQQRFNKEYHWSDIFDKSLDDSNKNIRSLLIHYSFVQNKYIEYEKEIEVLEDEIEILKKKTCKNCLEFIDGKCKILNLKTDIGGCLKHFRKK